VFRRGGGDLHLFQPDAALGDEANHAGQPGRGLALAAARCPSNAFVRSSA